MYPPTKTVCFVLAATLAVSAVGHEGTKNTVDHSNTLVQSSLLYGILSEVIDSESNSCSSDIRRIFNGIEARDLWALRLLDTSSNIPPSFVFGNNFWFSPSQFCTDLNGRIMITLSDDIPKEMNENLLNSSSPVLLSHKMVYANFYSPMQIDLQYHVKRIIHIGLCVPASCSGRTISDMTQKYFDKRINPLQDLLEINLEVFGTKTTSVFDFELLSYTSFYLFSFTTSILVLLTLLGQCWTSKKPTPTKDTQVNNRKQSETITQKVLKCFNFNENWEIIFQNKKSSGFFGVIAGIRSIVCIWIIWFHILYHSGFTLDNFPMVSAKMEWFQYQPIFQAYLYVDVFFVISAILLVYNFLNNKETNETIKRNNFWQNTKYFLRLLLHRYLRLTPVVIITMIISQILLSYIEKCSPFWVDDANDLYCQERWWQNLLYIQNFYKVSEMCSSWTWYLACDMQFYIVILLLLFISVKNPTSAKTIYFLLTILSIGITYYLNYINNFNFKIDVLENKIDIIYTKPWTRFNPYLSGALIGWILYKYKDKSVTIRTSVVTVFWIISTGIFIGSVFMTFKRDYPVHICALIQSIGKYLFGYFIGGVILMCTLGYGGFLTKILGHNIFVHLNKLTYCMYMLNPIVITAITGLRESSFHFDESTMFVNMISIVALSYFGAILVSILVEFPFQKISEEFVLKKKR